MKRSQKVFLGEQQLHRRFLCRTSVGGCWVEPSQLVLGITLDVNFLVYKADRNGARPPARRDHLFFWTGAENTDVVIVP